MSLEKAEKAEKALNIFQKGYNQQVIFYGPPGTSKTYTSTILAANTLKMIWENRQWKTIETKENEAKRKSEYETAQEYLNSDDGKDRFALVQFHPSYTYEDFIRGIEVKTDNSQVTYDVVNKVFGKIAKNAQDNYEIHTKNPENTDNPLLPYVLIIDEINRAPLASVLGELIYGLEYRGNAFSTPYTLQGTTDNQLVVPPNLFIIGTMNTADRSIGAMDYAVRRRFAFISLPSEPKVIVDTWERFVEQVKKKKPLEEDMAQEFAKSICDAEEIPDFTKENSNTADQTKQKTPSLYAKVRKLFEPENMADPSIDPEDIKLGHTYFLFDETKCKDETGEVTPAAAAKYMQYRLDYQIKPILKEYVKDGLLNASVMGSINDLKIN